MQKTHAYGRQSAHVELTLSANIKKAATHRDCKGKRRQNEGCCVRKQFGPAVDTTHTAHEQRSICRNRVISKRQHNKSADHEPDDSC